MSEKQFEVINARWQGKGEAVAFEDTQTNQVYFAENQEECKRIVELLNEQQDNIERLKGFNKQLREINKELGDDLYNCRLNNNFSNYLIYPITICKNEWEIVADEIKDGYEDLKRAKEQGEDRNEKTGHIIVIQFEGDMKI